ncbi:S-layer homology domain-containing protein [Paenibacillus sp. HJGM_3]|uniref:S-layer homology domain-containing protein n=1 Tax=Paenibacillus sp. HJGM_3 TaxID=3379816 RepID=UPI00385D5C29
MRSLKKGMARMLLLLLVAVTPLLPGAGVALAEGPALSAELPPMVATGIEYVLKDRNAWRYDLMIDRERLPESMKGFTRFGREVIFHSPNVSESTLIAVLQRIKPAPFSGSAGIGFPQVPGDRTIITVLYDDAGVALGYHLTQITIEVSERFTDLSSGHWAYIPIQEMVERNWLEGYADGTFQPDRLVTRAEFAKLLVLAFGLKTESITVPSFEDIAAPDWFTPYVEAAMPYMVGYLQPNGNVRFKPQEPVSREEAAMAVMMLGGESRSGEPSVGAVSFTDSSSISAMARRYVAAAAEQNIVSGFSDGSFQPQGPVTRAQAAVILMRAIPVFEIVKKVEEKIDSIPVTNLLVQASSDRSRLQEVPDPNHQRMTVIDLTGYGNSYEYTYALNGKFNRFLASLGLSQTKPGEPAAVKYELLGDGKLLYVSEEMTSDKAAGVNVNVAGVKQLKIRIIPQKNANGGMSAIVSRGQLTRNESE